MGNKTSASVVKWFLVAPNKQPTIAKRLQGIQKHQPVGIPKIISFGFSEQRLRLETEFVAGSTLANLLCNKQLPKEKIIILIEQLCASWREQNFVHGDLSLRNIVFNTNETVPKIWFIDWLVDLDSFQGTPLFASSEVFRGKHSIKSDQFALDKINKLLRTM